MGPNGVRCRGGFNMDRCEYAMLHFNTRQSNYMPTANHNMVLICICLLLVTGLMQHQLCTTLGLGFHLPPYSCSPVVLCLSVHPPVPPSVCLCACLSVYPSASLRLLMSAVQIVPLSSDNQV